MTANHHLDSARDWADIAVKQKAEIDELKARLSRYESLDASAPILDAASVAEFAGLARSVAASHERLRAVADSFGRIGDDEVNARVAALTSASEQETVERIAAWLDERQSRGLPALPVTRITHALRRGYWKGGVTE